MELQLDNYGSGYHVDSFIDSAVVIGEVRHKTSLIITPQQVIHDWPPQHPDQLTVDDLEMILSLKPAQILVGTGSELRFPDSAILKGIIRAGIGIDFMDSRAVCRTYNILASEGRHVAAGIIIDWSTNVS